MFTGCQNTLPKTAQQTVNNSVLSQTAPGVNSFDRDLSIARLSERHNEVPKAKKIYTAILQQDPQNQEALHRMGVIAAQEGRIGEAFNYIESAIAQGNASAELLGDLGYIQYKQGRYGAAEDTLNRSLDRDPRHKRSLNNLGLCLVAQKKYARALSLFRQIGTEAEAYANLAYAQSQQGDIEGAEQNYHLALEADPDTKVAAEGLLEIGKHHRLRRARLNANNQSARIASRDPRRERGPRRIPDQTRAVASNERVRVAAPRSLPPREQTTTEPQIGFYPSRSVLSRNVPSDPYPEQIRTQSKPRLRASDAIVSVNEAIDPFIDSVANSESRTGQAPGPPIQRAARPTYSETMPPPPTTSRAAEAIVSVNDATDRFIDSVANVAAGEEPRPLPVPPNQIVEVATNQTQPRRETVTHDFSVLNVQVASFEPVDYVPSNAVRPATMTTPIQRHAPQATNPELFDTPPPAPAPLNSGTPSSVGEPKKQGQWWPDQFGVALEPVEQPAPQAELP